MMNSFCRRHSLTLLLICSAACSSAHAYLGSFEAGDGYHISLNGGVVSSQTLIDAGDFTQNGYLPTAEYLSVSLAALAPDFRYGPDVSRYNAGEYTTSLPLDIRDGTGLWTALYGGRLVEDDFGAPWDGWGSDYIAATSVNAHSGTQSLAMRAMDDMLIYDYQLDSRDMLPATQAYQMSFWLDPSDADNSFSGNVFDLCLNDVSGLTFLEIGYSGDDLLQYRLLGQADWTSTGFRFGTGGWSEVSLTIDSAASSFSLSGQRYDDTTGTLESGKDILLDGALGFSPGALSSLSYKLQGGYLDSTSLNEAHFFDDVTFNPVAVPEPGSALLVALSMTGLLRRRR